jgi:hypothetical protein
MVPVEEKRRNQKEKGSMDPKQTERNLVAGCNIFFSPLLLVASFFFV